MTSRLPAFSDRHKLCIICEGPEEYDYLDRLKSLNVWNPQYDVKLIPADGNGNIPARYQDSYQNGAYEVVFVFCDTDKKPYEQYADIKAKINDFHGVDNAADAVVIFGNPCTMQIIMTHWDDVKLKSPAKKRNAELIEQYTGVENYKARKEQRRTVMEHITAKNYEKMCLRVKNLIHEDTEVGSSNFSLLVERLESADVTWIDEVNHRIEG